MAKRGGGNSGGGTGTIVLILFLVFFILLSIGLGVSTYLGFSAEDDKAGKIEKLKKEFSAMEKERDWYRFQSDLYRAYMGQTQGVDFENLAVQRLKLDNNSFDPKLPGRDEVDRLVKTVLDKQMTWDAAQKRPKQSYEQLLAEAKKNVEKAEAATAAAVAETAKLQLEVKAKQDELLAANKAHQDAFAAFQKKANDELAKHFAENQKLREQLNTDNEKVAVQVRALDDDKRRIENNLKVKDTLIASLRKELKRRDDQILILKQTTGEAAADLKKDWKILSVDRRGETAYINLGSADSVQPGLTFRVHGIGPDGRPLPRDKAKVQVLKVIDAHLSQVSLFYNMEAPVDPKTREPLRDRDGRTLPPPHDPTLNPVVKGDIIVNPSWYPNQKKHIAIAGVVDITGDGRDDTEQFVRELGRQNIVVDAYLDLRKDFTIKGPGISVQTDFLILGEMPDTVVGAQGRAKEIKAKIDEGMRAMQDQASKNGVKVKNLRDFLDEIGYRIPGNSERKRPSIDAPRDAGAMPRNPAPPAPAP